MFSDTAASALIRQWAVTTLPTEWQHWSRGTQPTSYEWVVLGANRLPHAASKDSDTRFIAPLSTGEEAKDPP